MSLERKESTTRGEMRCPTKQKKEKEHEENREDPECNKAVQRLSKSEMQTPLK